MVYDPVLMMKLAGLLLAIGALGGFLSGLLGVGGGTIFVPTLFFTLHSLGFPADHIMHMSVGTALLVIVATVVTSSRNHHKRGAVSMAIFKSWGPWIVAGVLGGSVFAGMVDGEVLEGLFAICTIAIAIYMGLGRERVVSDAPAFLTMRVQQILCVLIGIIAAMTGMGGAILTVPLMTYIGIPMQMAVGTGAALGVLVSIPGVLGYMVAGFPHMAVLPPYSVGYVNIGMAALLIVSAVPMAPLGVKISHKLDRKILRRIFAVVLFLVSLKMFSSLL